MRDCLEKLLALLDSSGPRLHALLVRLTLREDVAEDLMRNSPFYERMHIPRAELARQVVGISSGVKEMATQLLALATRNRAVVGWRPAVVAIVGETGTAPFGTTRSLLPEDSAGSARADSVSAMRRRW